MKQSCQHFSTQREKLYDLLFLTLIEVNSIHSLMKTIEKKHPNN